MGCIETMYILELFPQILVLLNSNMGCIETHLVDKLLYYTNELNSNMGCIETKLHYMPLPHSFVEQ